MEIFVLKNQKLCEYILLHPFFFFKFHESGNWVNPLYVKRVAKDLCDVEWCIHCIANFFEKNMWRHFFWVFFSCLQCWKFELAKVRLKHFRNSFLFSKSKLFFVFLYKVQTFFCLPVSSYFDCFFDLKVLIFIQKLLMSLTWIVQRVVRKWGFLPKVESCYGWYLIWDNIEINLFCFPFSRSFQLSIVHFRSLVCVMCYIHT